MSNHKALLLRRSADDAADDPPATPDAPNVPDVADVADEQTHHMRAQMQRDADLLRSRLAEGAQPLP